MRLIYLAIVMLFPVGLAAQNAWEAPARQNYNPDQKYLEGAVPMEEGRVIFTDTIKAPGRSASQIYRILKDEMEAMTKASFQFEQSRLLSADSVSNVVCATYQEWLVFKQKPLVLDRTRLYYTIYANCYDGMAVVKMTRIHYLYDEERKPLTYSAEKWITDEYALKKSKKGLSRITGKFRRKTIDRKDNIFDRFRQILK